MIYFFLLNFWDLKFTDDLNASADEPESNQEAKLNDYSDEVNKLWEKLMYLEVVIVDQIEVRAKIDFFLLFEHLKI